MGEPFQRDPRNPPGPFYALKGICLACGLPEGEAPELLADLKQTCGETYFTKQPHTTEEVRRACMALRVCCVSALRYGGKDPDVIRLLGTEASLVSDHLLDRNGNVIDNPNRPDVSPG